MQTLDLKVPPVAVVLVTGALMWLVARTVPSLDVACPARQVLAAATVAIGLVVAAMGVLSFRIAKTTVNPMKPDSSSALVVTGIYRWTRNPMYLGFLFVLLGWGIFLSNASAFLMLPGFVLYLNRFQIEPEERALTNLFGEAFLAYRTRVRKWI